MQSTQDHIPAGQASGTAVQEAEADLKSIGSEIRSHESAVSAIDREIDALMRVVRQLQYKKWEHNEKIKHCKGLITLARRLPCEVLAYIFEICVQDGYTRTPMVVSHVCSQWRKAASISSVWSHVYIDFDGRDPCGRTRFWLEKAENSYLRITLEIRREPSKLPGVMDLLLEKRLQWRFFTVNSVVLLNVNRALAMCAGPFPELRAFYVSIKEEFDDTDDQPDDNATRELVGLRSAFLGAPRLDTVHIDRSVLPAPGIFPPSITNLSLVLPSDQSMFRLLVSGVLRILEGLPCIEVFSLVIPAGNIRQFERDVEAERSVTLFYLLSITLAGSPDINTLLQHIVAPNLKFLHLRSSNNLFCTPDEGTGRSLLQFLERASPPIEELELRDSDIPAPHFLRCFSRMSRLRILRLHESEISDPVLKELFGPHGLCPHLSIIDLRWCGHFTGATLVGLVRSRARPLVADVSLAVQSGCSPITKVIVIHCSFVHKRDIADLAALTLCQVAIVEPDDYCRAVGCCVNDRYRKRLAMEGIGRGGRLII